MLVFQHLRDLFADVWWHLRLVFGHVVLGHAVRQGRRVLRQEQLHARSSLPVGGGSEPLFLRQEVRVPCARVHHLAQCVLVVKKRLGRVERLQHGCPFARLSDRALVRVTDAAFAHEAEGADEAVDRDFQRVHALWREVARRGVPTCGDVHARVVRIGRGEPPALGGGSGLGRVGFRVVGAQDVLDRS